MTHTWRAPAMLVLAGWFDLYAKSDGEGMANLYSEDALLMPPGAPAVTGADVSGDTGWISGNYTVVDASGAAVDSGSYLSVHKRTNGQWLYIRDTWNSDRPPAPK